MKKRWHVGCGGEVVYHSTPSAGYLYCTKCKASSMHGSVDFVERQRPPSLAHFRASEVGMYGPAICGVRGGRMGDERHLERGEVDCLECLAAVAAGKQQPPKPRRR